MIRKILCYALAVAMAALAYAADTPTPAKKATAKKAPVSKAPAKGASTTASKKPLTFAAARSKNGKKAPPRTTWRNRQMAPTPERYKEIQDALVAKGYLKPEDVGGGWNQNSMDALKRFQSEQNIDSSGKINSLSLIALGLGPKHDSSPPKPAEPTGQDR
ncbi:Peptidoglycan-binding domain 1 protein [Candidatus Sulfopaludibacter sp. SbA3]|nr:Peptidoglycan-binding domain 1 protein [Candidatus Sulfopaludibacter sp. SbA3]